MNELTPIFTILGIAGGAHLGSYLLEESGNGGYVLWVKIGAYSACAVIALREWWDLVNYVMRMFGV